MLIRLEYGMMVENDDDDDDDYDDDNSVFFYYFSWFSIHCLKNDAMDACVQTDDSSYQLSMESSTTLTTPNYGIVNYITAEFHFVFIQVKD